MLIKEFQDFDNGENFAKVLAALQPLGFEDSTWVNDACPSVTKMDALEFDSVMIVYVDYADPEQRENGSLAHEFAAYVTAAGTSHEFDSADELIAFVQHTLTQIGEPS
jgi:hypothetical protein